MTSYKKMASVSIYILPLLHHFVRSQKRSKNDAPEARRCPKTKRWKAEEVQKREEAHRRQSESKRRPTEDQVVHRYGSKNRPAEDKGRPKTKFLRQGTVATHKSIMQLQDLKMP